MLDNFKIKYGCKPMATDGAICYDLLTGIGVTEVNYSSILTRLIQEAGRYCESYASDLFIDWQDTLEKMSDIRMKDLSMLFGFRADGVDDARSVFYHEEHESLYVYRSIWRLDVKVTRQTSERKDFTMTLYRVR